MISTRSALALFAVASLLCLAAVPLHAQVANATLLGTVTDASGAVVPNAKITVTETNTGIVRERQTNDSGNYTFPTLPPGSYSVTVEASGFKKETRTTVDLIINTTTRVDVQLQPGNVSETIEVSGAAPLLETDRTDIGRKIETGTAENMPLAVNRNFQSLLTFVPGAAPMTWQHSQFFNATGSLQTEVNGQMRHGNNFMIEGTDDNERTGLLQILVPPVEAIQTVDISTSNFDPEFGRATGAVTNVLLKSGSNSYHGSAYEFIQNSAFVARDFFNTTGVIPHLAYNYVGGNIGGPIKKNKLFFFGDYLRTMDHELASGNVTVPTPAQQSGNFSSASVKIYDPLTGNPDGTGRTQFQNNIIPAQRINLISTKILALLPPASALLPTPDTNPSNNFFYLSPFTKTTDSFDIKMDYNISDKDRLSGRFSFQKPVVFQAPIYAGGGNGPGGAFMGTGTQKTYVSGINYNRVFSPTFLAEFRLGVAHYHNEALSSDFGTNASTALGIPGINVSQLTSGLVGVNLNSSFSNPLIGYSASLPWIRAEANVDFVNTWTKIVHNHTIKFGFDLKRLRDDLLQGQSFSPRGIYNFGGNQTALCNAVNATGTSCTSSSSTNLNNNMASFLLDIPSSAGRDLFTYFPALRAWETFIYAGDKWVVTPKLTADIGVRWEYYPPATPAFPGGFSNYDPTKNQLVVAGVGGNPMNLGMVDHKNYFAPRLGLAYRLNDKTVVRAGFGMSYTPFPDNTYAYNYPVRANNSYQTLATGDGFGITLLDNSNPNSTPMTFANGFPVQLPIPVPSNGIIPAVKVSPTLDLSTGSYDIINLNFKNPYVEQWNVAVQRSLPLHLTLDVAYVGSHGVDTVANYDMNSGFIPGAGNNGRPQFAAFGRTAGSTIRWVGYSSTYNGMHVKLDRRFSSGLTMTTSFAWQKSMSYQQGDDGSLRFYLNQRRNYARTDFDRTLNYVQSLQYALPIGPGQKWVNSGLASKIIGGWQVSGIITMYTGTPFTITANGTALALPNNTQTATQLAPIEILHGINTVARGGSPWLSVAGTAAAPGAGGAAVSCGSAAASGVVFCQPVGSGVAGTLGRNVLSGPGAFRMNLSAFKMFKINERFNAELRCDSFNTTNTPMFSNPGQLDITNQNFGAVTSTVASGTGVNGLGGGRSLQLGIKLNF